MASMPSLSGQVFGPTQSGKFTYYGGTWSHANAYGQVSVLVHAPTENSVLMHRVPYPAKYLSIAGGRPMTPSSIKSSRQFRGNVRIFA